VQRTITGFWQDDEGHFVAELDCGHRQHMRHQPPMTFRPWVLTEEGRAARIGADIECVLCDRAEMPAGYEEYRRTAVFDATSVPQALLREHRTKLGVWGKLLVHEGQVDYVVLEPERRVTTLGPGAEQVIVSALGHEIAPREDARFTVAFYGKRGDDGAP
jgi:tellurite methyltransferase